TALIWILSAIGVVLIVAIIFLLLNRDQTPDEPETPTETAVLVTIPEMDGMDRGEITTALSAVGLVPEWADPQPSDEVEAGLFLESTPPPGQQVDISDE